MLGPVWLGPVWLDPYDYLVWPTTLAGYFDWDLAGYFDWQKNLPTSKPAAKGKLKIFLLKMFFKAQ